MLECSAHPNGECCNKAENDTGRASAGSTSGAQAAGHGDDAGDCSWKALGGRGGRKATRQERPGCSLASKANGKKSRAVHLPMEKSISQCLAQHWKSASALNRVVQRAPKRMSKITERLAKILEELHLFNL